MKWRKAMLIVVVIGIGFLQGCTGRDNTGNSEQEMKNWLENAKLSEHTSKQELYQNALEEDTLVIYSVSSRMFEVKEKFEEEYPGLTVDIRDIRGNDVVEMILHNYESGSFDCDLVVCSDCDGSLYQELIEPGIVYTYIPWDIAPSIKGSQSEQGLAFLGETMLFIYNNEVYESQPIQNIWELTDEAYHGKIMMANPLSSFSTYGFCTAVFTETEAMEDAYEEYFGIPFSAQEGKSVGEAFWEMAASNIVFTNSSDEVLEGIENSASSNIRIGIMISSKLRYQELGYHLTPIYHLNPFASVYTPNSITIAGKSQNINSAKLFIRYLLGETDGTGEGLKPFSTVGTWSTRIDVPDGNPVPLSEIDVVELKKEYLYENREKLVLFFENLLKEQVVQ